MALQGLEVGDAVALHVCGDATWEIRCDTLQNPLVAVLATAQNVPSRLEACFKEKPSGAAAAALPQDVVFADQRAALEEFVSYHNDEAVSVSEDPSLKYEITSGLLSVETLSSQENLSQSTLQCSNSSDKSLLDDVCHLKESFEGSISDDENLIEIIIPDDHFVVPEVSKAWLKPLPDISRGLLTNLVPEPVLGQHGLMELLSETSEDDNLIEIDITRGCIKCSRMGIISCII
ncbi:hypothetical protein B296_00054227 [Ensete ventricosum]|uniref:Uncharacterized protein n=1 Tax=Ensete ventricosum TaxID=4639 RepID=A0A426Y5J3_ENSVE|nr:hypothetical protein B296_00054227 [Ensete ventricosum]